MKYDFTQSSNRKNTSAEKYIAREDIFGTKDIIPLWIADMDIDSPIFIKKAIEKRLQHQIYGYEKVLDNIFLAQILWLNKRYNTTYNISDVLYSHSVVSSMNAVIDAFTRVNDEVIILTPVYAPLFNNILQQNRKAIISPLKKDFEGNYTFDFKDIKSKITLKTKLFLLCNPHNPIGRAWRKKELEQIVNICKQNNIIIFSDEIHCDLVYLPKKHKALSTIKNSKEIAISAYSIGKTFNLSGLNMSTIIIEDKKLQKIFKPSYDKFYFSQGNILSHIAFKEAYTFGEIWLDKLKLHLYENYIKLKTICDKYPNLIKLTPIEATYLAWLDCSKMNMTNEELKLFFVKKTKLGLSSGVKFGNAGNLHMRLNFAVSSMKMDEVILLFNKALNDFK
jgi:cystathionine beta-lyase